MQHRPAVLVVDVISVVGTDGIVVIVLVTLCKRNTNTRLEQTMGHHDGYSSSNNIDPGPGYYILVDCKNS